MPVWSPGGSLSAATVIGTTQRPVMPGSVAGSGSGGPTVSQSRSPAGCGAGRLSPL